MERLRPFLLIGVPALAVIAGMIFYFYTGRYVSTDDAYVQAARVQISANISGRVTAVRVHDNQMVHAGDILLNIDPRLFQIAVNDAQAKLDSARIKIQTLQATYHEFLDNEVAARETLAYRQKDFDRERKIANAGIASRAQLDAAQHELDSARQALMAAQQQTAIALANLGGNAAAPAESRAEVRAAQATLDRARLNLSYTVIHAPIDGIVTKVELLQAGDYINLATPLFALVSQKDIWVEANFKETDLTYIRPGQKATLSVDAYPDTTWTGTVQSSSPGTGSSFSLLPPENSSGNWVKVVQRLPLRLSIDANQASLPLAAGMSVVAEVDTNHHRSLRFWK